MLVYPFGFIGSVKNPGQFDNLWGWWNETSMNITAGKLTSWTDLGPNGFALSPQGTNPDVDIVNGPNGVNAVDLDTESDAAERLETSNSAANLATRHHFEVIRIDNYPAAGRFIIGAESAAASSNAPMFISDHTTNDRPEVQASDGATKYATWGSAIATGTWFLLEGVWDSGTKLQISVDGGAYVTTAGVGTISPDFDQLVVGGGGTGSDVINVSTAERAIYTDIKTGADLTAIRNYFTSKYGSFGTW